MSYPPRTTDDRRRSFDVAVLGATGMSGRLVTRELTARGLRVVLGGRDPSRLADAARSTGVRDTRVVDLDDPQGLSAFLGEARLAVNAVGPYALHGEPVLRAALAARTHLVALAGEQAHVARCRAVGEEFRAHGLVLAPAMGIEVAVSDCAASLAAAGLDEITSVDVGVATAGLTPSRASARSAIGVLTGPTWLLRGGELRPGPPGTAVHPIPLAAPFRPRWGVALAGVESFTVPVHVATSEVNTYAALPTVLVPGARALVPLAARILRSERVRAGVERWGRTGTSVSTVPDEARFQVVVEASGVRGGRAVRRIARVTGARAYATSAAIAAWSCARLLVQGAVGGRTGALPPAWVVDPAALFQAMESVGLVLAPIEERRS